MDFKAILKNLKIDLHGIADENLRGTIILLLNAIEQLVKENDELRQKNQALMDEVNRLKGEQGQPSIRSQTGFYLCLTYNDKPEDGAIEPNKLYLYICSASGLIEYAVKNKQGVVERIQISDELGEHLINIVEVLRDPSKKLNAAQEQAIFSAVSKKGHILKQKKDPRNHSSDKERGGDDDNGKNKNTPKPKKDDIKIDRIERCDINKDELPPDAVFKGLEVVIVQDIKIITDNVKFEREAYYSASQKKTYLAPLPLGYNGQFGPTVKALVLDLYQDGGMTESALKRFLETHGVYISSGTISSIITDVVEPLHQEKTDIVDAGLDSTDYHHLDDTAARVNGKNHHAHILCNPFFMAYFTLPKRDRLATIEVLSNGRLIFCINEDAYILMEKQGLAIKRLDALKALEIQSTPMTQAEMDGIIKVLYPVAHRYPKSQKIIRECAALIGYRLYCNKTKILLTDGALQFLLVTEHQGLCWVHEGRHYKKLNPIFRVHQEALEDFRKEFWTYYRRLLTYKKSPNEQDARLLEDEFNSLFTKKTGYKALDERIASTLANKERLLLVLTFPHIPLHNNPAEGGARVQARKRDINLQTKNAKGTKSKDTLMTIVGTARKLSVNSFKYILDRITGKKEMPSLADLIRQRASIVCIPNPSWY